MLVAISLTLISVLTVLFAIFHFSGSRELCHKTAHFHGPTAIPTIGCPSLYLGDSSNFLKQILNMCKIYKSPFRFVLGLRVIVVVKDPEQIKTVLQSSKAVEKDYVYSFAKPWLGDGLVTAENKVWRVHRRIIQPTFNQKVLQSFVSIFHKNSLLLLEAVKDKISAPEFDLSPYAYFTTFSNICESSMGVSVDTQKKELEEYLVTTRRVFNSLFQRLIRFWLHSNTLFNLSQLSKSFYTNVNKVHKFTDNIVQERKQKLQIDDKNKDYVEKRKPTLDLLLELSENENKLTDKELRDEVITIIVAGSDTTARTIDFVFLMLAHHPEVQAKVYEEIYNIYGSEDPEKVPIKWEDLSALCYLERVIKETMRIFPAGPMIARQVSDDLDLDGYTVPKGCTIGICIIGLHRDEKLWPDPLKFDPDRFLPEEINKRHPLAYSPFVYGSRDCLGRVYAVMSIKVIVANFLRKYIVIKDNIPEIKDIRLKVDTLLKSADPVTLRIEKRVK